MGWTVLCVSKISPAQVTRNMILERAGYQIVAIDDPNEAVRIFKTSEVSAVVFGDSINGEQRVQLAQTFKNLNHVVPIVALSNTIGSQSPAGFIDQQLESLRSPSFAGSLNACAFAGWRWIAKHAGSRSSSGHA